MYRNNRGVALLQVLMITALLGGLSAMVLRVALARTTTSRQTRHTVASQLAIESCMSEVNSIWALKSPTQYTDDLQNCQMISSWTGSSVTSCAGTSPDVHEWYCRVTPYPGETEYCITAKMSPKLTTDSTTSPCRITYTIDDAIDL